MNPKIRKIGAALVAVLLFTSMVGGAAALQWDTETTNTTTTSDVSGASNSIVWYADSETETVYFEVSGATTSELRLDISNGADGINSTYLSDANPTEEDATNGHYSWNISHATLRSELPSSYTGGTYDVEVINTSGTEEVVEESSEITLTFDSTQTTARVFVEDSSSGVESVGNDLVADSMDVETEETWWGLGENRTTATYRDDVAIDGNNTTVQVAFKNSSAADAMSAAAEGYDNGEWVHGAQFVVSSSTTDAKLSKVYLNEAPSETPDTYAVYDNSSKELTLHSTEFDDAQELHIRGVANQGYSFGDLFNAYGIGDALGSSLAI